MKQTNNKKNIILSLFYFSLGLFLVAEPFFLKRFYDIYWSDFNYPLLTLLIGVIFEILGIRKFQAFTNTSISETILLIYEANTFFYVKFLEAILSRCKFWSKLLLGLPKSLQSNKESTGIMVDIHRKRVRRYSYMVDIYLILLVTLIPFLFSWELPHYGSRETIIAVSFHAFYIYLCIGLFYLVAIDATKQQKNAEGSYKDLKALVDMLKNNLEEEGWRIEYEVILPQRKRNNFKFLIQRLLKLESKRDIDVVAISPDGYISVIELKSHIGDIFWNSQLKKLCRQMGNNPEPIPFEKDFFKQVEGQAKRLYDFKKLSRFPDRILIFWRATVKINPKKRLINKVKISDPSRLVKELKKRNEKLVKENGRNMNDILSELKR